MTITIILISILALSALVFFMRRKKPENSFGFKPFEPKPIEEKQEIVSEGEMPIKPQPVDCQKAAFRASPEEFFYVDCCGKPNKGEGFQPWEKRAPVSIDVNKPFMGMDLLGEQGEQDC